MARMGVGAMMLLDSINNSEEPRWQWVALNLAQRTRECQERRVSPIPQLQPLLINSCRNSRRRPRDGQLSFCERQQVFFGSLLAFRVSWTLITLIFKWADLLEICAELVRFIMTTGLFFWMLTNGPQFAQAIIGSLWQLGGQAAGGGTAIYPGDLITLGMQVMLNSSAQLAWMVVAPAAGVPFIFAVIILILCALIAVNMILLLVSAWVILYAGVIFLGFGGCRWTSDMAINYYKTVLGVGVSLLVMQLVIGIGQQFLQGSCEHFRSSPGYPWHGNTDDRYADHNGFITSIAGFGANIAIGSGHHGGIGALGFMSAVGAAMAASSIARSVAGAAGPIGAVGAAGMAAGDKIMERISAATGGNGNGSSTPSSAPVRMNAMAPSSASSSRPAPSSSPPVASAPSASQASSSTQNVSQSVVANDPPESRPTAPDESRGLEEQPDFGISTDDISEA